MSTTAVKERPILFSGEMVKAILDGRKTQTRRIVKPQPELSETGGFVHVDRKGKRWMTGLGSDFAGTCRNFAASVSPFKVGQRLWVRETWASATKHIVAYRAGGECGAWMGDGAGGRIWNHHGYILEAPGYPFGLESLRTFGLGKYGGKWRPSIHMPRWASRITLEITEVRVQRLLDISEEDAKAEGVEPGCLTCGENCVNSGGCGYCRPCWRDSFAWLWQSINGPDSWNANPWVWAITFRKV